MIDQETDIVSRGYLTTFFIDIDNLKNSLTGYRSIMLRLNINTGTDIETSMEGLKDEKMKNAVITWSDSVRHNVERCQISLEALSESIPDIKKESLTIASENYEKIINQFAPNIADVKLYVFEINKIFIKSTLEKLLTKMETFYEQFTKK